MRQFSLVCVALLAGFAGGALSTRVRHPATARVTDVVRAGSFELVDASGAVVSSWGRDKDNNPVLVFADGGSNQGVVGVRSAHPAIGLRDDLDRQRFALGVDAGNPFLKFRGRDGKTRVRLYQSYHDKPVLLLEDETGPRVSLGIEQSDTPGPDDNDWTLVFHPDRARIGMFTEGRAGQRHVRGILGINRDKVKYPPETK